jgi:hypothetical protein
MKTISYIDRVHKWGKAWNFSMLGIMLMFPIAVGIIFKAACFHGLQSNPVPG